MSPCAVTGHPIAALCDHVELRSSDHAQIFRDDHKYIWKWKVKKSGGGGEFTAAAGVLPQDETLCIFWVQNTWVWLLVVLSTVNGTDIGAQELGVGVLL